MYPTLKEELQYVEDEMKVVMGQWNGEDAGIKEDRANLAEDVIEASKNLKELLAYFE